MQIAIHWLRRDIRLADNAALAYAAEGGRLVIPVFIWDPAILTRSDTGGQRISFLKQSLDVLDADLQGRGSRLLVRQGQPEEELLLLARELGAGLVVFNRDYEPLARARDQQVTEALQAAGIVVQSFNSHLLTEPGQVLSGKGEPYTVYTPFKRAALERLLFAPPSIPGIPANLRLPEPVLAKVEGLQQGAPANLLEGIEAHHQPGGEAAALARLKQFASNLVERNEDGETPIAQYASQRNFPADPGTSRLSAHLRMGTIGVRTCYQAALQASGLLADRPPSPQSHGGESWIGELLWRDFYYQIMWHYPQVETEPLQAKYKTLATLDNQSYVDVWAAGQTGYPIVDAGVRQMNTLAWMHNRVRMVTASFFCKHLRLDYRLGERIFMQRLEDGDLASNNGGWQWVAGSGTDAQPYYRIFNPTLQGERYDPAGDYVRQFVPELANVPQKYIHSPWLMPTEVQQQAGCVIGKHYPAPIVDHKEARVAALAMYEAVNKAGDR